MVLCQGIGYGNEDDDLRWIMWKFHIGYIVYLIGRIRTESECMVYGHGHLVHRLPVGLLHDPMALSVEPYLGVESIGGESGYVITLIGTPSYGLYVGIE